MNRKMDPALVERMKKNGMRKATMIKDLDTMPDMLEDLGGGRGVTDPVSGEAVVEL